MANHTSLVRLYHASWQFSFCLALISCVQASRPYKVVNARGSSGAAEGLDQKVQESSDAPQPTESKGSVDENLGLASLCGKKFDPGLLEAKSMVKRLLQLSNFQNSPLPKALAMSADGFGFTAIGTVDSTVDEARRVALYRCNAITGGKPCSIVVEGDKFCPNGPEKEVVMDQPSSPTDLPFVFKSQEWDAAIRRYMGVTAFKAFAVTLDGYWAGFSEDYQADTDVRYTAASQEEASRLALEKCEAMSPFMAPCTLFLVGNEVVLDLKKMNWNMVLDFSRRTFAKPVPFIPDVIYDKIFVPRIFPGGQVADFKGVLYMSPLGILEIIAQDPNLDIDKAAQNACTARNGNIPCMKLAQNNTLVWTADFLKAKQNPEIHCSITPRASCEAHRAAGCTTNGTYYVVSQGALKETDCRF